MIVKFRRWFVCSSTVYTGASVTGSGPGSASSLPPPCRYKLSALPPTHSSSQSSQPSTGFHNNSTFVVDLILVIYNPMFSIPNVVLSFSFISTLHQGRFCDKILRLLVNVVAPISTQSMTMSQIHSFGSKPQLKKNVLPLANIVNQADTPLHAIMRRPLCILF